jgi:hypothetical protein
MDVVAFDDGHVDAAAALLHASFVDHAPQGARHRFGDLDVARRAVAAAADGCAGFAAVEDGDLIGYLLPPPTGYLGVAHLAARPDCARLAYRGLYEAASHALVDAGVRHHSLPVLVDDAVASQTFFELEFGVDQIDGIIDVSAASPRANDPSVRHATPADVDAVVDLAFELQQFHARAPMFQPGDGFDERAGAIVAMAQADPSGAYGDAFDLGMFVVTERARSVGVGTAMLDVVLAWAAPDQRRVLSITGVRAGAVPAPPPHRR